MFGFVGRFFLVVVSFGFRFSAGSFGVSRAKFDLLFLLTVLAALLLVRWGSCLGGTTSPYPTAVQALFSGYYCL